MAVHPIVCVAIIINNKLSLIVLSLPGALISDSHDNKIEPTALNTYYTQMYITWMIKYVKKKNIIVYYLVNLSIRVLTIIKILCFCIYSVYSKTNSNDKLKDYYITYFLLNIFYENNLNKYDKIIVMT